MLNTEFLKQIMAEAMTALSYGEGHIEKKEEALRRIYMFAQEKLNTTTD